VGIATTVAAGNNGATNALSSPACISSAVSVGATTKSDVVAAYSNAASFLSLFAPGDSITSSSVGGGYTVASGTSMAAPHVAATWAVLRQAAPTATVSQVLSTLQSTGLPDQRHPFRLKRDEPEDSCCRRALGAGPISTGAHGRPVERRRRWHGDGDVEWHRGTDID
jgi:subtilisin family serine protease